MFESEVPRIAQKLLVPFLAETYKPGMSTFKKQGACDLLGAAQDVAVSVWHGSELHYQTIRARDSSWA